MAVLPVKVRSPDNGADITTNALLDKGAGNGFITDSIAKKMGLKGQATTVKLCTMTQKHSTSSCRKIRNVEVKGINPQDQWLKLDEVYTHDTVSVKRWKSPKEVT